MLNYIVSNIALQSRKTIMAELACSCFSVALIFSFTFETTLSFTFF